MFKEVDDFTGLEEMDEKRKKERQSTILNDLLHPEKRSRHREGYEDGNYTLFTENSISLFIEGSDHIELLSKSSSLIFDPSIPLDIEIKSNPLTTREIVECLKDLKVLGKKDFRGLLKWRSEMRLVLNLDKSRKQIKQEIADAAESAQVEEETPETLAEKVFLINPVIS